LIRPVLEREGVYFMDISLRGNRDRQVLEVFVDTDEGITTEKCAEISRAISPVLDTQDVLVGRYSLMVSSPGLDRLLTQAWQFRKNVGRRVRAKVREVAAARTVEGQLVGFGDGHITIKLDEGQMETISLESLVEAKINLPW